MFRKVTVVERDGGGLVGLRVAACARGRRRHKLYTRGLGRAVSDVACRECSRISPPSTANGRFQNVGRMKEHSRLFVASRSKDYTCLYFTIVFQIEPYLSLFILYDCQISRSMQFSRAHLCLANTHVTHLHRTTWHVYAHVFVVECLAQPRYTQTLQLPVNHASIESRTITGFLQELELESNHISLHWSSSIHSR